MAAALLVEDESLPTEMALTRPTEAEESPLCPHSLPGNDTVVGVDESHVRLIYDKVQELPFGLGHSPYRSKYLQVCGTDVQQHTDVRLHDSAQVGDVTHPARAHLDDGGAVFRRQSQYRPGYADLIVLAVRRRQDTEPAAEHSADHLLRRRLARRAGHSYDRNVEPAPVLPRQSSQSCQR